MCVLISGLMSGLFSCLSSGLVNGLISGFISGLVNGFWILEGQWFKKIVFFFFFFFSGRSYFHPKGGFRKKGMSSVHCKTMSES